MGYNLTADAPVTVVGMRRAQLPALNTPWRADIFRATIRRLSRWRLVLRSTEMTSRMKNKSNRPLILSKPSDADISDYAFHLYQQSSCAPGHDLDNWFEATACLNANIPAHHSGARLHHHVNGPASYESHALGDEVGRNAHSSDLTQRTAIS